jgi:hypothetical protein
VDENVKAYRFFSEEYRWICALTKTPIIDSVVGIIGFYSKDDLVGKLDNLISISCVDKCKKG